jgi:hypothetical protein
MSRRRGLRSQSILAMRLSDCCSAIAAQPGGPSAPSRRFDVSSQPRRLSGRWLRWFRINLQSGVDGHNQGLRAGRRFASFCCAYGISKYRITACLSIDVANSTMPSPPPYLIGARGVGNMDTSEVKYCLTMARSLDAAAARTRDDSYLRKLLEEQAAKYRAEAARK